MTEREVGLGVSVQPESLHLPRLLPGVEKIRIAIIDARRAIGLAERHLGLAEDARFIDDPPDNDRVRRELFEANGNSRMR